MQSKIKKSWFSVLFIVFICQIYSYSETFADTNESNAIERSSVSEQQTNNYKNVASTALKISLSGSYRPLGPHEGPGFLTGVGPVLQITWFKQTKEKVYEKFVPIAHVISIDKILNEYNIVFYRGPFENAEYAIASDEMFEKIKGRWINYLASQESSIK